MNETAVERTYEPMLMPCLHGFWAWEIVHVYRKRLARGESAVIQMHCRQCHATTEFARRLKKEPIPRGKA